MEKNRGTVIAVIAALVVSVISLGVAFAAFSAQLTINGSATIEASTWDIHFSETAKSSEAGSGAAASGATISNSYVATTGTYAVANDKETGTLNSNNFTWEASFKTPGDTVQYEFYIVNAGDYNATLTQPVVSTPTCSLNPCPVTYTVTKDGSTAFGSNEQLAAGASQKVVVTAQLNPNYGGENGGSLNSSDIDVSVATVTFGYQQSGTAVSGN